MLITCQKLPSRTSFTMSMIHVWLVKLKPLIKLKSSYMIWRSFKKIKTRFQGFGKFKGIDRFRGLEGINDSVDFFLDLVLFYFVLPLKFVLFLVSAVTEYLTGKNWCSYLTKRTLVKEMPGKLTITKFKPNKI